MLRSELKAHQATLAKEKEWWENKKNNIKEGFMKELDQDGGSTATSTNKRQPASASASGPSEEEGSVPVDTTTKSFEMAHDNPPGHIVVGEEDAGGSDNVSEHEEANANNNSNNTEADAKTTSSSTSNKKKKKGKK